MFTKWKKLLDVIRKLNARQVLLCKVWYPCVALCPQKKKDKFFFIPPLQLTPDEEEAIKIPVIKKYEKEGHPYYASSR